MAITVEAPVVALAFGLGDEPRPAAAGVEVFDKNFGIKPFSVLGPDGMGLELGDDLLGQQFHNGKILETARNARTAKETKPPCANEDKSSSLGIFAQGGYLAGPGGDDEVYPRKIFRIFVDISNERTGMNRIILIGNGFDLAHNLPTSYKDFMRAYQIILQKRLLEGETNPADGLCSIKIDGSDNLKKLEQFRFVLNNLAFRFQRGWEQSLHIKEYNDFFESLPIQYDSPLFASINKAVKLQNWVDIESEYYSWLKRVFRETDCGYTAPKKLNDELELIKIYLVVYLHKIQNEQIKPELVKGCIDKAIYEPFAARDMSVESNEVFREFIIQRFESVRNNIDNGNSLLRKYNKEPLDYRSDIEMEIKKFPLDHINDVLAGADGIPDYFLLPDQILLLNFNYTTTADMYLYKNSGFEVNHIHGTLGDDLNHIIFGYGDEMDDDYKTISKLNDNDYLTNIKSIRYLETDKYRQLLRFINSDYYQIYIMGHSCGNSDRTLLNTLFEHPKCVSIKPFYYQWQDERGEWQDNYIEIIQNISRNFNSMQTMRDRVVNKEFCRPLIPKDN